MHCPKAVPRAPALTATHWQPAGSIWQVWQVLSAQTGQADVVAVYNVDFTTPAAVLSHFES